MIVFSFFYPKRGSDVRAALFPLFIVLSFNPEFAVAIYCGLKILAATIVSRFCSSTYL